MDEQLEHMINRKLDGELCVDEVLELDKMLIRDPDARQELELSLRIDEIAGSVIEDACSPQAGRATVRPTKSISARRLMWLAAGPLAAAACLALWVLSSGMFNSSPDRSLRESDVLDRQMLDGAGRPALVNWKGASPYRQIDTSKTYYSLYDEETGNVYMIEVRRTGSTQRNRIPQRPNQGENIVLTSGDM